LQDQNQLISNLLLTQELDVLKVKSFMVLDLYEQYFCYGNILLLPTFD
jgi:hypothetical protein